MTPVIDNRSSTERGRQEVVQFVRAMHHELDANEHKGDWTAEDAGEMFRDLIYHVAKLHAAMRTGNKLAQLEYSADIANEAVFLTHITGAIGEVQRLEASDTPTLISDVIPALLVEIEPGLEAKDASRYEEMKDALFVAVDDFLAQVDEILGFSSDG